MKERIRKSGYIYLSLSILILAVLFAVTMVSLFWTEEKINQTTVGTIYLGDKSAQDYEISILLGISEWKNKAEFSISYQKYSRKIPLDIYEFDIDATLLGIKENETNSARFKLSEQVISEFRTDIQDYFGQAVYNALDIEKLIDDVLKDAEKMSLQKTYTLYPYLDNELSDTSISISEISNIHSEDIAKITSLSDVIKITADTRFSLLDSIASIDLSNEQLSIVASGIQSVIMPTCFSGIISQQYLDPPLWAEIGKNVRILKVSEIDFSFFNPLDTDFIIKIEKNGSDSLRFELIGFPFIGTYSIKSVTDNKLSYQTKYIVDMTIGPDTSDVIITELETETIYSVLVQEGKAGSITIFYRTVIHPDGSAETSSVLQQFVNPQDRIYRQRTVDKEYN
ncbi:MAG: hypothetical protein WCY62_01960 [Clostridia bacterium]